MSSPITISGFSSGCGKAVWKNKILYTSYENLGFLSHLFGKKVQFVLSTLVTSDRELIINSIKPFRTHEHVGYVISLYYPLNFLKFLSR